MTEILFKTKNYVVIYKPTGIPAQSDLSGDADAMSLTAQHLRDLGEPDALWLVHRLDRVASGIMIFARNKKYAAILSESVRDRLITKEYYAVVDGECEGGLMRDLLVKDAARSKAFVTDRARGGAKEAVLTAKRLASVSTERGVKTLVSVSLQTGRFHQIRAQLSSRGTPITGDGKYGSRDKMQGIALMAAHLFIDLGTETVDVSYTPDRNTYPWSLFNESDYRKEEAQ